MASNGVQQHKSDCEADRVNPHRQINYFAVDFSLRLLTLTFLVASLVTTVTSNQTKVFGDSSFESESLILQAKFTYSSAIIYFVVGLAVAGVYTILTGLGSLVVMTVPAPSTGLLVCLAFFDAVMAAIVASGTGGVASIAYIGLKGNDHIGWTKICDVFDKFCWHAGSAITISLAASIVFIFLVGLSTYSLHVRIRKGGRKVRNKPIGSMYSSFLSPDVEEDLFLFTV